MEQALRGKIAQIIQMVQPRVQLFIPVQVIILFVAVQDVISTTTYVIHRAVDQVGGAGEGGLVILAHKIVNVPVVVATITRGYVAIVDRQDRNVHREQF